MRKKKGYDEAIVNSNLKLNKLRQSVRSIKKQQKKIIEKKTV